MQGVGGAMQVVVAGHRSHDHVPDPNATELGPVHRMGLGWAMGNGQWAMGNGRAKGSVMTGLMAGVMEALAMASANKVTKSIATRVTP